VRVHHHPSLVTGLPKIVGNIARLFVGYSFLYLSDVAQPGNQIDRSLNVTRIPFNTQGVAFEPGGPTQPALNINSSSFWAQGINFGLELRF